MTTDEPFTGADTDLEPVTFEPAADADPLPCPDCRCVVCRRLRE